MKNYSFDSIIKDKAAGHEAPVPADAWNNIKKQKRKKRGIYWWIFAVLLIGTGLFGLYQMQYPSSIATKTSYEKNIRTAEKVKIIPGNNDADKVKQTTQLKTDSITRNVSAGAVKSIAPIANEKELPATITAGLATVKPVKPSANKKATGFSIKDKIKKESTQGEILSDDLAIVAAKPIKNKRIKNKILLVGNKNKRSFKGKTRVKIAAPATGNEGEKEFATIAVETADEKITAIDIIINSKDSLNTTKAPVVKKELPANDSSATPITKAANRNKRTIFADISAMPFVPVQNSASLLNIKRITVNNFSRSEFTTDEIRTTVTPALSYGIALRKKIAAKWYAGAGVQFTKIKENIKLSGKETNTIYSVVKRLDNTSSFLVDDTIATVTQGKRIINATNSYDLISIPVFVQYNLAERKTWSLSLNGGLNFTIKNSYKNSIEGTLLPSYITAGKANKKENKITTDVFAAIRLSRTAGKNLRVYAEPTIQFNLQQYKLPGMVNYKNIHRAGLNVGVTYQVNY